jgi:hypothetical protein
MELIWDIVDVVSGPTFGHRKHASLMEHFRRAARGDPSFAHSHPQRIKVLMSSQDMAFAPLSDIQDIAHALGDRLISLRFTAGDEVGQERLLQAFAPCQSLCGLVKSLQMDVSREIGRSLGGFYGLFTNLNRALLCLEPEENCVALRRQNATDLFSGIFRSPNLKFFHLSVRFPNERLEIEWGNPLLQGLSANCDRLPQLELKGFGESQLSECPLAEGLRSLETLKLTCHATSNDGFGDFFSHEWPVFVN